MAETLYRKCVWLYKGLTEYTRYGFLRASNSFNSEDLKEDITNRAYMVTGANSGIGKSAAQKLASRGATVYLVCRSEERGEAAKKEIIERSGNEKVELHILDLAKPRAVVKFTEEFVNSGKPIDVLVNSAARLMEQEKTVSEDGLESNFCVNSLGTYILTSRLFPALERSSRPQVVTVSSGGMLLVKLEANDIQLDKYECDGYTYAAQNKRQQVVMTRKWAEDFPCIHFSSMHPGWADTPAVRKSMPGFHWWMQNRLRSPEQGADTIEWLCSASAAIKLPSGSFFQDRKIISEHLPLAQTQSSPEEQTLFMTRMEELAKRFSNSPD